MQCRISLLFLFFCIADALRFGPIKFSNLLAVMDAAQLRRLYSSIDLTSETGLATMNHFLFKQKVIFPDSFISRRMAQKLLATPEFSLIEDGGIAESILMTNDFAVRSQDAPSMLDRIFANEEDGDLTLQLIDWTLAYKLPDVVDLFGGFECLLSMLHQSFSWPLPLDDRLDIQLSILVRLNALLRVASLQLNAMSEKVRNQYLGNEYSLHGTFAPWISMIWSNIALIDDGTYVGPKLIEIRYLVHFMANVLEENTAFEQSMSVGLLSLFMNSLPTSGKTRAEHLQQSLLTAATRIQALALFIISNPSMPIEKQICQLQSLLKNSGHLLISKDYVCLFRMLPHLASSICDYLVTQSSTMHLKAFIAIEQTVYEMLSVKLCIRLSNLQFKTLYLDYNGTDRISLEPSEHLQVLQNVFELTRIESINISDARQERSIRLLVALKRILDTFFDKESSVVYRLQILTHPLVYECLGRLIDLARFLDLILPFEFDRDTTKMFLSPNLHIGYIKLDQFPSLQHQLDTVVLSSEANRKRLGFLSEFWDGAILNLDAASRAYLAELERSMQEYEGITDWNAYDVSYDLANYSALAIVFLFLSTRNALTGPISRSLGDRKLSKFILQQKHF